MTSLKNAVIINHHILHAASSAPDGVDTVSRGSIANWGNYVIREGRFEERGGNDKRLTSEDLRLEARKATFNEKLVKALEYNSRSGAFENKGTDKPLVEGEVSGAIWDRDGVISIEDVAREIEASGSNVVQTVFTISREWAPMLNMASKEDWQRVTRGKWDEFMSAWGVIPEGNQRWVAAYHVDAKKSVHVHVLSWDSGKNGLRFTGDQRIPHAVIQTSQEVIRKEVFKHLSLERSVVKDWVRDAAVLRAADILGLDAKPGTRERVVEKAEVIGEAFRSGAFSGDASALDRLIARASEALPENGAGRTAYKCVNVEARAAANLAADELLKDAEMARLLAKWIECLEMGADIIGLDGKERDDYIRRETADLHRRLASKVLDAAGERNTPWARSNELKAARNAAAREIAAQVPAETMTVLVKEAELYGTLKTDHIRRLAEEAIASEAGRPFADAFIDEVVSAERERSGGVSDNRQKVLTTKAEAELLATVTRKIKRNVGAAFSREERRDGRGEARFILRRAARYLAFTPAQEAEISKTIDSLKLGIRNRESEEKLMEKALTCAQMVMETPELKYHINRVCELNHTIIDDQGKARFIENLRKDIAMEMIKAAEYEILERFQERMKTIDDMAKAITKDLGKRVMSIEDEAGLTIKMKTCGLAKELRA